MHYSALIVEIACKGAILAGDLTREWIEVPDSYQDLKDLVDDYLASSPYADNNPDREFVITDIESDDPNGSIYDLLTLSDLDLDDLIDLSALHQTGGLTAIAWYQETFDPNPSSFEDLYCGSFDKRSDFIGELWDQGLLCDLGSLPDRQLQYVQQFLDSYIDFDKLERDLFIDDYACFYWQDQCHVYRRY